MRYRTGMNLPYDVKWYLIADNLIDRKRPAIFEIYLIDRNTIYSNVFKFRVFYFLFLDAIKYFNHPACKKAKNLLKTFIKSDIKALSGYFQMHK